MTPQREPRPSRSESTALSGVRATMFYTADTGRPPDYFFRPPDPGHQPNPPGNDPRYVFIHDAWDQVGCLSLDREGFELHRFEVRPVPCDAHGIVTASFYPAVIDFVRRHTGARRVEVFDHTLRKRLSRDLQQQTSTRRPAVQLVHSDYTVTSAPQRVRDLVPEEAEQLLQRRIAFYNVWKPISAVVEELPLAMIDARTQNDGDLLRMPLHYPDRTGEIYVLRYSPTHRWLYFPQMEDHHALLLKTYDSTTDGRCRFMGHSAFDDPTTLPGARERESIEVRTMAFF